MARKVFINETTENTNNLFELYLQRKTEYDKLKKEVESLAEMVKTEMEQNDQKSVEVNGYKINKVVSQRVTWKEDLLLEKVKTYDIPELVKTIEQVDVPQLEQAIIDAKININDLQDCQTVKEVVQLRLAKVKESNDE